MKVFKFSGRRYLCSLALDSAAAAVGYAEGYRDAAEECSAPIAAYAESEADLMRRDESDAEVDRALAGRGDK